MTGYQKLKKKYEILEKALMEIAKAEKNEEDPEEGFRGLQNVAHTALFEVYLYGKEN